jgi:hypothetical protein
MSILTQTLLNLFNAKERTTHILKGGLILIYRPPTAAVPRAHFSACRAGTFPSDVELRTLRNALNDALDQLDRIAYDVDAEWQRRESNGYGGHTLTWSLASARDISTADPELRSKLSDVLNARASRRIQTRRSRRIKA